MTKIFHVSDNDFDTVGIKTAARILRDGGLVAFPTETVYGLGANALSEEAVKKIFAAKGRPNDNPLIVHIADIERIYPLVTDFSEQAKLLAEKLWPGPLTLVLQASSIIPSIVTAGLETVAIRMPEHEVARRFIAEAGVPVAAPSANLSGKPSPTSAAHVLADLNGRIDAVIDGGECTVGVESTVLDISGETPLILRPGGVTKEMLEKVLGKEIKVDNAHASGEKPRSPGMKYTHYSPEGEVFLVTGHGKELAAKLKLLLDVNDMHGLTTAFILFPETAKYIKKAPSYLHVFTDVEDEAKNLYHVLRNCDEKAIDVIYCETVPKSGLGLAVMNRLTKAAGGKVL